MCSTPFLFFFLYRAALKNDRETETTEKATQIIIHGFSVIFYVSYDERLFSVIFSVVSGDIPESLCLCFALMFLMLKFSCSKRLQTAAFPFEKHDKSCCTGMQQLNGIIF